MKNYLQLLTFFIAIAFLSNSCNSGGDNPAPTPTAQKPTINSFTITNIADTYAAANYSVTNANSVTISVDGGAAVTVSSSPYTMNSLSPGMSHTAVITATNSAGSVTSSQTFTTTAPTYTAVVNTTTSFEGSATATDKVLLGGSIAKGFVFNVTNAGTAKVEVIGTLTNNSPAVAYYWINGTDSTDINAACSTLNSTVAKTAITSQSFTINLNAGMNVLCFKTARYSGLINNGGSVGLKVTLANNVVFTTLSYTADSVSPNVAAIQKMQFKTDNNMIINPSIQATDVAWGSIQLTPYSDELGTVFDGNLFPKIYSIAYDTTNAWCSPYGSGGSIAEYSSLDFNNTQGSAGKNFRFSDGYSNLFSNSNATYNTTSNSLSFNLGLPAQILKSAGNFAYLYTLLNVYNIGSSQFGPASVSFKYKSVRFLGNPELWIYDVNGNRIQ